MSGSSTNLTNVEVLCGAGDLPGSQSCVCDWRVQLEGCPSEKVFLRDLYLINVVACFIVFLMLTGLLIWRTTVRGQRLISSDPLKEMGILKPRPLEGFLLLNLFHVAGRLLYSVCLLSNYLDQNSWKEFFHDITFTIALAGIAIYLIGLIYTIPKSHAIPRRINSYTRTPNGQSKGIWVPRPAMVDAFGFFVLLGPIVFLNTFAILSGFFLDQGKKDLSKLLIKVHYFAWSFFCWFLICGLLYFGKRLTDILDKHIKDTKEGGRATPLKVNRLEHGLRKLRRVLYLLLITLLFFAITSLLFALFREGILKKSPFISRTLAAFWVLIVPVVNVFIITILAKELNDKEPVHFLRQSTFIKSQFSSSVQSPNQTSACVTNVYPRPSITSIGRISPIQLPASKLSMFGDNSQISDMSIDSRIMSRETINLTDSDKKFGDLSGLVPLAPAHILTSPTPEYSNSPIVSFESRQKISTETVTKTFIL
ncbi:hypothetical protein G9A89_021770 [Geosiphon pyriformis]|nr:hypothetical protein G9A89_021770 [Geosiphon pyriformis]